MATLEQDRARFALGKVNGLKVQSTANQAKFKTQLVKLPSRLHTSGLGQTVAFYLAAGGDAPESEICSWLETWLATRLGLGDHSLLACITGEVPATIDAEALYREASSEARAVAVWFKRFAEAFLSDRPATGASAAGGAGEAPAATEETPPAQEEPVR